MRSTWAFCGPIATISDSDKSIPEKAAVMGESSVGVSMVQVSRFCEKH
jgi:hypothetical protein